ncbi:unnamed protein product [Mytilus coruscus]|uniref:B box-type domain-containing protein n=1 Tax=Mytilus coruscus TaxID=42192 RepID=A0A6J8BCD2_MYTCO|nr:unnamed protein product [Mytilus coruscus]
MFQIKKPEDKSCEDSDDFIKIRCKQHMDHVCCLFCKICNENICLKCLTDIHKGHDVIEKENYNAEEKSVEGIQREKENKVTRIMSEVGIQREKENQVTRIMSEVGIQREKENQVTRIMSEVGIQMEKENQVTRIMSEVALGNSFNSALNSEQEEMREEQTETEIKVTRQFTIDINNIFCMSSCHESSVCRESSVWISDGCHESSVWISDGTHDTVMHLKLKNEKPQIISQFDIVVHDMAVTPSGDLILVVDGNKTLQVVDKKTGQMSNSKYTVSCYFSKAMPLCIHVTKDKVITGTVKSYQFLSWVKGFLQLFGAGNSSVLVMDHEGNYLKIYEVDENRKPLFTVPERITSTSNGNICVVDGLDIKTGRIVILGQAGSVVGTYEGNPTINSKQRLFHPADILTTPSDNIVVADRNNHTIHILDMNGQIIANKRLSEVGIRFPYSLGTSVPGYFFIGCHSPETDKAKLYEVKFSGF